MEKKQVINLFNSFNKKTIVIIGDVMVDSYVLGNVSRISPEAPVPILSLKNREERLGGASNVALNIQSVGATPILCSVIGQDETGITFMDLLSKQNISNHYILRDKSRKTSKKTRIIANNQQLLRVDDEDTVDISESTSKRLVNSINNIINSQKIDGLLFQDYNKGVINKHIIENIIQIANKNNIPVLVDPKKSNFNDFKNITLFKPNLKELKEGLNFDLDINNSKTTGEQLIKFINKNKIHSILLTLSEQGVIVCSKNEFHHIPAEIRDIADVSGAGDTVISIASLCVASNIPLYETAYISNLAGGLVCESAGVIPINKEKLIKELTS
ncbi:bifunctional heptose 7-phosphate kinase/heptose 1-phosphate adenyltransferase [Bacteroidota bacterium]